MRQTPWIAGLLLCVPIAALAQDDTVRHEAYQAQIAAAEKSLRLDETRELRRWLDACEPALRGWEWSHLAGIADTSRAHYAMDTRPIRLEMSPAGDRVALVEGSSVRLLTWPGMEEVRVIEGHGDAVYRAVFDAQGKRLFTVSRDVTARSWDIETGEEIAQMKLSNPAFAAVAIAPDGDLAATCAWERGEEGGIHGMVWVWDPASGEVLNTSRVGDKPLSSIVFLPDGSGLVVGSWDGLVHLLDRDGTEMRRIVLPDEGAYNAVDDIAVSPDGRFIAAAPKDRVVRVFERETGELVTSLRGHGGGVQGVRFSPDGNVLASASADSTVVLWDTGDWARIGTLRGPRETVTGVAFSQSSDSILAIAPSSGVWAWEASTVDDGATRSRVESEGIYSCVMSPDGETVVVAEYEGNITLLNARDGSVRRTWEAHPEGTCHDADFSDHGLFITASWDQTARVWDVETGEAEAVLKPGVGVRSAAISPDGRHACTSGGVLQFWDVQEQSPGVIIEVESARPDRVTFSSDGTMVASAWSDGAARVHSVPGGALVGALTCGQSPVQTVCFSRDDQYVFSGDAAGVIRGHRLDDGALVFETTTEGRPILQLDCSDTRIAAGSERLWVLDAASGSVVFVTSPTRGSVYDVSWSADGSRLATCTIGGEVVILESEASRLSGGETE